MFKGNKVFRFNLMSLITYTILITITVIKCGRVEIESTESDEYEYDTSTDRQDSDVGYDLGVGKAIDLFANYGDLVQVSQVISADYDAYSTLFSERNIRVWSDLAVNEDNVVHVDENMSLVFCDTLHDLLGTYFNHFHIEGTDQPYKAFMGDWIDGELMKVFGLELESNVEPHSPCCFVLVKLTKVSSRVSLGPLQNATLKEYFRSAVEALDVGDLPSVRRFMRSYGTHYIDSYATGNALYQVFVYKSTEYVNLKASMTKRKHIPLSTDDFRYYFASYFLKQIGEVRVASGNKTIEGWAQQHLRNSQYLFTRPNLLQLRFNSTLAHQLNKILDNEALLAIDLKILKPIFEDKIQRDKFAEIVDNDLKLWDMNM